jgi:hypothetical protein
MTVARSLVALALQMLVLAPLGLLVVDMAAHRKVERLGGVNMWGYRGPVMRQRQPNEIRIAIAGGDFAFGWGVAASETLVYGVRQLVALQIDRPGRPLRPVTAVNLGAAGLPLDGYAGWIERYAELRPDVIVIALDPVGHSNTARWRLPDRQSAIFHMTSYSPILPLVLEEKGALANSRLLSAAGAAAAALDRLAGPALDSTAGTTRQNVRANSPEELSAADRASLEKAIRAALSIARGVVVIAPPYPGDAPSTDVALYTSIAAHFAADRRVRFVALGDEPAMYDEGVTLDGFHLSAAGHAAAAEIVTPAALELIGS